MTEERMKRESLLGRLWSILEDFDRNAKREAWYEFFHLQRSLSEVIDELQEIEGTKRDKKTQAPADAWVPEKRTLSWADKPSSPASAS